MSVFQKQTNSPNSNDIATSFNKTFGTSDNFYKKKCAHQSFLTLFLPFSSWLTVPKMTMIAKKKNYIL